MPTVMPEAASPKVFSAWDTWQRATSLWSLLRLTPFDTSTEQGRSQERYRRIVLSALASAGAKSIAVVTTLVSVPLTVSYLGYERYGMWMTMSSIIAMLGFADLGVGNGLLNAVAEADGKNDRDAARRYVSSAFFMLVVIAILLQVGFVIAFPFVPWPRVFNVTSESAVREAAPAMAVFMTCLAMNIPLGVIDRLRMAYQAGFVNSLWAALGNLLGLSGVLLAIYLHLGLPWLVLAMAGGPILASLANGIVLFGIQRPWLQPCLTQVTAPTATRLLRLSALFFILQVTVAVAYASDNIVAAQVLGPEAVTQYAVPARMFSIVPMLLGMVLTPLWPAYRESLARGDFNWAKKTLLRSLRSSLLISAPLSTVLVAFGVPLVHLWIDSSITPSFSLLLGLGIWNIIFSVAGPIAMFLNGASIIRFQVLCALLLTSVAISLKILMTYMLGIPGLIWSTIIAHISCALIPSSIYTHKLLAEINRSKINLC